MTIGTLLAEGKNKLVYLTDEEDKCVVRFGDEAMAYNGLKRRIIPGKGKIHNAVCCRFFELLRDAGVPVHYLSRYSETEMLVKRVEILPVSVVVRNLAAGEFCDRMGVPEGRQLSHPVTEYHYRRDGIMPMVNSYHITALNIMTDEELEFLRGLSLQANGILLDFLVKLGVDLVDLRFTFGKTPEGEVVIADEITPASCRFRDAKTGEKLDLDIFRYEMGDIAAAYADLARRVLGEDAGL